ncbi:MAG: diaminobutyrate acetyltransferase [Acidimicrobiia bacterium]|nr:diaminobutyrate acetyltransferase [Acidimicrobiia bacterium]
MIDIRRPTIADGADVWRVATRAGSLDVNSSYSYLLWCRDFAATSTIARRGAEPMGFVTGYLRPDAPDTLVVWQVAVVPEARGERAGARMLAELVDRVGPGFLEATVTPDNEPSRRLFGSLARDRDAAITFSPLFASADFPEAHEPEELLRIGPFDA